MDQFDVLTAISEKKIAFKLVGMDEHDALMKAIYDISSEYHISLPDIKKLVDQFNLSAKRREGIIPFSSRILLRSFSM